MLRSSILVPAFSILLLAGAAQAQDHAGREPVTSSVRLSETELNASDGARQAYVRLNRAAKAACDSEFGNDLRVRTDDRACARAALDKAVADLNRPALSRLHAEKTGQAAPLYAVRETGRTHSSK